MIQIIGCGCLNKTCMTLKKLTNKRKVIYSKKKKKKIKTREREKERGRKKKTGSIIIMVEGKKKFFFFWLLIFSSIVFFYFSLCCFRINCVLVDYLIIIINCACVHQSNFNLIRENLQNH